MGKRIAYWLFIVAALAITCWGVVSYVHPTATCHQTQMRPGDVCHKSTHTQVETATYQTYEERIAIVREQAPFVIGIGAIATAFGVVVLVQSGRERHRAVDHPVALHERGLSDATVDEVVVEE
ncbi:MAG: hypothetical protein E7L00_11425 [Propionibacteriaceae bacterium]|nr:hypothetical protein [Propionibacteriaceae bacterium]